MGKTDKSQRFGYCFYVPFKSFSYSLSLFPTVHTLPSFFFLPSFILSFFFFSRACLLEGMAKGSVKRKATPSSVRKKKAQQRIRKKVKQKIERKKPNWRMAAAKTYLNKDSREQSKAAAAKKKKKASRGGEDDEDEEAGFNFSAPGAEGDGGEVQSDVDEDRQERLNQRNPLETQLFLKGLPLDTSEEELMTFFTTHFGMKKAGRVLLVRNKLSKTLAGTAFLHCGSAEMADKIFTEAQKNARELAALDRQDLKSKTEGLSHHQAKRMAYKLHTDATVARDPFLTLRDMKFTVLRVLSRSDAQEAVSSQVKKKKRTKAAADDPRHLYLLQEGLITRDSPAARDLHPKYLQMIEDDYEARKQQLRNSNYFVSTKRLSVRNLPRTMTENDVRRLFAGKVREYLKTHKEDTDKGHWGKYGPIMNVKLLRDTAGVSKGYAFIEFVNHNIALNALRMVNNNPTLFGDNRRLMVSFSIENMDALKKLERMKEIKKHREIRSAVNRKAATSSSTASDARKPRGFSASAVGEKRRRTSSAGGGSEKARKKPRTES